MNDCNRYCAVLEFTALLLDYGHVKSSPIHWKSSLLCGAKNLYNVRFTSGVNWGPPPPRVCPRGYFIQHHLPKHTFAITQARWVFGARFSKAVEAFIFVKHEIVFGDDWL